MFDLFPAQPWVSLPEKAAVTEGEERTLQCDITGFYPEQLAVTWLIQNGSSMVLAGVSQFSRVCTEMAVHNQNGTYSTRSGITLHSSAVKDREIRITCQVEHRSYKQPYKRSVTLTVQGEILLVLFYFLTSEFKTLSIILLYNICYLDLTNPFSLQLHHSSCTVLSHW